LILKPLNVTGQLFSALLVIRAYWVQTSSWQPAQYTEYNWLTHLAPGAWEEVEILSVFCKKQ